MPYEQLETIDSKLMDVIKQGELTVQTASGNEVDEPFAYLGLLEGITTRGSLSLMTYGLRGNQRAYVFTVSDGFHNDLLKRHPGRSITTTVHEGANYE